MHYLIGIPVEVKAYDKDKDTYKIHDDSKDETWFLPADFVKKHGKTTFKLDFTTKKKSFWAKIKEKVLK